MTYILISTQIRTECGPTLCGDEFQDPRLMSSIGATLKDGIGHDFKHYEAPEPPRIILERLDGLGYELVGFTGCGQTVLWTMKKKSTA